MKLIPRLNIRQSNELSTALFDAIHNAILTGHDEPSRVANLAQNIPKYLKNINSISSYSLSVGSVCSIPGSVFIHQTPKVTYKDISINKKTRKPKSIEIGDLLLLVTIKDRQGNASRKAMLLQAKMFDSIPVVETGNDDQHTLYQNWPIFKYIHGNLKNQHRYIYGFDIYSAAKYLLLNEDRAHYGCLRPYWFRYHLRQKCALSAEPSKPLSNYHCFAHELYDFILDNAGKPYELMQPMKYAEKSKAHTEKIKQWFTDKSPSGRDVPKDGWDLTINDLLHLTAKKTTRLMREAPGSDGSGFRGVNIDSLQLSNSSSLVQLMEMHSDNNDNDEPPEESFIDGDEPVRGLNVVEFVFTSTEERPNSE